jgi:hypothetical protein
VNILAGWEKSEKLLREPTEVLSERARLKRARLKFVATKLSRSGKALQNLKVFMVPSRISTLTSSQFDICPIAAINSLADMRA